MKVERLLLKKLALEEQLSNQNLSELEQEEKNRELIKLKEKIYKLDHKTDVSFSVFLFWFFVLSALVSVGLFFSN